MNIFLCYPKCSTCKKARAFLDEHHISYSFRDIKIDNPTFEELKSWISLSNLEPQAFFNKSGLVYKELNLKDKLKTMAEEEQIKLLSSNGMLVKRPLFVTENQVIIGYRENKYKELI